MVVESIIYASLISLESCERKWELLILSLNTSPTTSTSPEKERSVKSSRSYMFIMMLLKMFLIYSKPNILLFLALLNIFLFWWQTVNIKVKMDCDGCERRVKNAVSSMKGSNFQLLLAPKIINNLFALIFNSLIP